ncbi:hypothetical protein C8R44DRAFT_202938 [Mycena epipterygia]|nr:hypothetical protein C8R44DRAFT_202938 [Mycena epipterygia]
MLTIPPMLHSPGTNTHNAATLRVFRSYSVRAHAIRSCLIPSQIAAMCCGCTCSCCRAVYERFGWHTVPAVAVDVFVYLGFVAAGKEIEQLFGLLHYSCSLH